MVNSYGLNDEQWRAITAPSPAMINASAGSGKTRCLVAKVRYLLDQGVSPDNICAITFSNKAANEMKSRLKQYNIKDMQISTIHSMCVGIIRRFVKYTPLKVPFSIYDGQDQLSIIKTIIKARELTENPREILSGISRIKSERRAVEGSIESFYKQYQEILIKNNACDFDDLLVYAMACLEQADCQDYYQRKWPHILVDEIQDTSKLQYDIIMSMYEPHTTGTLFFIGDANQSIYGFRSAQPENMQDFIRDYNPTVSGLTYNYRCCPEIVAQANEFLQFGDRMISKTDMAGRVTMNAFRDKEDEAERIADAIVKLNDLEETAVLYRVNSRSLFFEQVFARRRIPYKVVGDRPFWQRRVCRDMIAYCRAAVNISDIESLARIINVPKRGFGAAKVETLLLQGRSYAEGLGNSMPIIASFFELLNEIKDLSPYDAVNMVLSKTDYRGTLTKDSDHNMISALLEVLYDFSSMEEFLLASSFVEKESGSGVKLMTAHASKGLEFKNVFVVGVEQDVWPHKNADDWDEEERLFFVACTRAMRFLNVSFCRSMMYRGQVVETEKSELFRSMYRNVFNKDLA